MYYLDNLTQDQIAHNLRISKSSVSRLLKEGREKRIVTFHINELMDRVSSLEQKLEQIFKLKEAVIVPDEGIHSSETLKKKVAQAGALLLQRRVQRNDIVAVSWGTTLAELAEALNPPSPLDIEVAPLLGGTDHKGRDIHSNEIARRMSKAFGGRYYVLHSPLIVSSLQAKRILEAEESIKVVLEKAKSANMVITGIGIPKESSTMVKRGYFSAEEFAELAKKGVVGDICTNFYDAKGNICELALDKRRVGLGLEDLRLIPDVMGVASGEEKAEAILGALRGGLVNMLVINKSVAEYLINMAQQIYKEGEIPGHPQTCHGQEDVVGAIKALNEKGSSLPRKIT